MGKWWREEGCPPAPNVYGSALAQDLLTFLIKARASNTPDITSLEIMC